MTIKETVIPQAVSHRRDEFEVRKKIFSTKSLCIFSVPGGIGLDSSLV